jgi:hypothetical protein
MMKSRLDVDLSQFARVGLEHQVAVGVIHPFRSALGAFSHDHAALFIHVRNAAE